MKAILVIDMPDGYKTDEVLVDYVLHTTGEYKVLRKCGNHGVRPMPEKMDEDEDVYNIKWFKYGFNTCVEVISNEKNAV